MRIERNSLIRGSLACIPTFLSAFLALSGSARADTLAFGINNTLPGPDNFVVWTCNACNSYTPHEVGWYFTPGTSFDLSGIDTYFSPNVSGGDNLSRTVNIVLLTDRGVNGGTLLGETSFNSDDAIGKFGGADFATPISLTGGTRYFVGFQNVASLGINTCFGSDTCGVTVLSGGSQDGDYSLQFANTFAPAGQETCSSLDCPALEFFQPTTSGTITPEPASLLLAGIGLGCVWSVRKKRSFLKKSS